MLKEAYDDLVRYKKDRQANSHLYVVFDPAKGRIQKQSSELRVGDLILVRSTERVPADLLLLHTSDSTGTVFIRTDQLDGETDWKLRRAIRVTQTFVASHSAGELHHLPATVVSSAPNQNIYEYNGYVEYQNEEGHLVKEPLHFENTLWANTVLASGTAIGLVLSTGEETRSTMNARKPRSKFGAFDAEVNYLSKLLFILTVVLSGAITLMNGFAGAWLIQYFRYILLLSSIIPISLRVNMDFAKAIFSLRINNDKDIKDVQARNSSIPEELGRVQFLLTDKTGTLTKNDMVFKKLSLETQQYNEENLSELQKMLHRNCTRASGPMSDVEEKLQSSSGNEKSPQVGRLSETSAGSPRKRPTRLRREAEFVIRDIFTAMVVCHNVTPTLNNGEKVFQASSPDEIALVKLGESLGMKLLERTSDHTRIENAAGLFEDYEVLANFPFSSETKRMGVLIRHKQTNRVVFFLKGADNVMAQCVKEVYRSTISDECEALAREGLRTLVFACRLIPEQELTQWRKVYEEANLKLVGRSEATRKAAELLEKNLDLLGITGVEDRLQDDVMVAIESMRMAGIKVWMLTGDKIETARCIAISTGIQRATDEVFLVPNGLDDLELSNRMLEFAQKSNAVLFVEGGALGQLLSNMSKSFIESAAKAPAVVCCRCLPRQKAQVVESLKAHVRARVAAIGDGGNDVGMIQSADVGVGLMGKEGSQAALASDFSMSEFRGIRKLILWHGRNSYKRGATLSQFVIHRGLIISVIQFPSTMDT
eukprot:TRINITY_DN3070_c0_g1_i2.p1 TRINITY_DN3070_c0_g1~~TRINITY_DN3070_c0_g1_i2.p1  ORF type:complete len:766 (-),score=175.45 TRINITY_DN3070_c0_g1_i2:1550-3847(-)